MAVTPPASFTSVMPVQPEKALLPTSEESLSLSSAVQPWNAFEPIDFRLTPAGSSTRRSAVQPCAKLVGSAVSLAALRSISRSAVQPWNAPLPIDVIVFGSVIETSVVLSLKASAPIVVTSCPLIAEGMRRCAELKPLFRPARLTVPSLLVVKVKAVR